MEKQPRHRPQRSFVDARRVIVECKLNECIHCSSVLVSRKSWHMSKTVQMMNGPVFVAGKSKECANTDCSHCGMHYYASGVISISLPYSTYGLDVLAFIGWQHEHEHRQLIEIQKGLNQRDIIINERNVGKLYRQFLALLGGMSEKTQRQLEATAKEYGGLIWSIDALQPEGHGTLLYVLYEVLSETPVSGIQLNHPSADQLCQWLKPYQELPFDVLATLSDGEEAIISAMKTCWARAPHQRCQSHFLGNLAEPVLEVDTRLRKQLREDLGGLPAVPDQGKPSIVPLCEESPGASLPFLPAPSVPRDGELMEVETQIRMAVRDAVNRTSRKPFSWGGLAGYRQLEAIGEALSGVPGEEPETAYLRRLSTQINRALERNRTLAQDLEEAHAWLVRIAECLRYPSASSVVSTPEAVISASGVVVLTGQQVRSEMEDMLRQFQPDLKRRPAQGKLYYAWHRLWKTYGEDLLHCYDIPGLPPDNLKLEALFEDLRRHQRRITGRKSTRELRDFGQYKVLFIAENEEELLQHLRQVPLAEYKANLRRLAVAEAPRQQLYRLHRNPAGMISRLLNQHAARRATLARNETSLLPQPAHTEPVKERGRSQSVKRSGSGLRDKTIPQNRLSKATSKPADLRARPSPNTAYRLDAKRSMEHIHGG